MSKTIIVSNRLPISLQHKNGKFEFKPSAGGLATGLGSIYKEGENIWIGWPGNDVEDKGQQKEVVDELKKLKMAPVFLTKKDVELYYEGFSNETIWPAFHYFTQHINYEDEYWDAYWQVNKKFCDAILAKANEDDTIWVHDYQLLLLPMMLRKKLPNATIAFFQHIPFPSYEIIRMLPWRKQMLEGMVGADLIGFHTYDDMRHFLSAVGRILGLSNESGFIQADNRLINVDAFPMGIDYDKYEKAALSSKTKTYVKKFKQTLGDQKLLLTIDRLDYSKGIPNRIKVFERLLDENPEYQGKVSMIMVVVPSRDQVKSYQTLKEEIDTLVGHINSKFSTLNWVPIHYFYRSFPFNELSAFYSMSDIALVTPLRDGMNLVCKEFVASKTDQKGVLILSEMAGASKELVDAILVNPNDQEGVTSAIVEALSMDEEEQELRMSSMQASLKKYDIFQWVKVFMDRLKFVKEKQADLESKALDKKISAQIKEAFKVAKRPLLLLDYDGTLVGFKGKPQDAFPDEELKTLVADLSEKCQIVIISGRDKETLGEWFKGQKVDMIAEHGVWLKRKDQKEDWILYAEVDDSWKEDIRKVMEYYVLRTPGALIEEKHHSLVWHYRKVESGLGDLRMRELFSHLKYMARGHNLQVLEGNKVLEIKRPDINKGRAATSLMKGEEYDFIMALGDDWTDEDTFKAMPKNAYTIRVGYTYTQANYNIKNPEEVRELLKSLLS
ncbi:bifunctional alpha,alpha-trehalose-phosphate synthase (UDP-forming)/trehalose-phosphatase [Cyclobacterium qasimii]|uniref:Alpha,alpha-trehalose-phosphate synthase n=2 Tax=Cyclobacterium qasimii TaxID=1350429 RepID=S7WRA4_9BACT|nr:bifunctional alpha,alpha-trehalose-phosphate synthase (UDP-forming)/trehalose-phosphatase [Cyclobacterium qasimii]EPR69239.1 Alpha,alpha-trehalose-phosphate synthase [Cyclobacterium qasimii M12-11B]GEO20973.1 bifunctional alpha,alpha-trehalose-phosphate synthase (UDP-forming)/trehalose-phosphatase [Cyclobacterium qasimii]